VTAVNHRHFLGVASQEQRFLHRGVTAADHRDLLVPEEEAVTDRAGRDAASHEAGFRRQAEPAGRGAGRDDDRPRVVLVTLGLDPQGRPGKVDRNRVFVDELRSKPLGLLAHAVHELRTHDPLGEAGIVLDF